LAFRHPCCNIAVTLIGTVFKAAESIAPAPVERNLGIERATMKLAVLSIPG